jgi:hypothetical protein
MRPSHPDVLLDTVVEQCFQAPPAQPRAAPTTVAAAGCSSSIRLGREQPGSREPAMHRTSIRSQQIDCEYLRLDMQASDLAKYEGYCVETIGNGAIMWSIEIR